MMCNTKAENSFICNKCGKEYKRNVDLNSHIKSNCGINSLYKCNECGKELKSSGSLHNHLQLHKELTFMCRFCAKLFATAGQLKVHERSHTQDKPFVCEICGKGFCHRQSLITHNTLHTGIKPFLCENCGKSFSCIGNLLKHRNTHPKTCGLTTLKTHSVKHPSTNLKIGLNTPKLKNIKAESKNEPKEAEELTNPSTIPIQLDEYETLLAKRTLINVIENAEIKNEQKKEEEVINPSTIPIQLNEYEMFLTKRTIINVPENDVVISDCELKASNTNINELETSADEAKLKFKCGCCRNVFISHEERRKHQAEFHSERLTCQECDKLFANIDSLRSHEKIVHKGARRKVYKYICEKCGKQINQKAALLLHEKSGCESTKLFECDKCNKKLSNMYVLKQHMRIHDLNKQYVCKFCAKSFHWKGQMKIHERSHTGEKPFTCLYCPKTFAYRESLVTHSSIHTGIKPHFCKACGARFSCIGNLIKHKSSHLSTCGAWYEEERIKTSK